MLDAGAIGYDLSVLAKNVQSMQRHASAMPAPAQVKAVRGARIEPGQENYTVQLKEVAGILAQRIVAVRDFVTYNADALNQAAAALSETDAAGKDSAQQAATFIEDIVETSRPDGGSRAGAPSSAPAAGAGTGRDGGGDL